MTESVERIWTEACKHLQELLHPDVYARWIAVIRADAWDGRKLVLCVDNDFYQTWLEENYLPMIERAVAAATGGDALEIAFVVRSDPDAPQAADTPPIAAVVNSAPTMAPRRAARREDYPTPALNARYTFEEFIIGPSNQFAHAATLAVAQAPSKAYNPLFLYGGVGLGKTHLMQAIGHHVLAHGKPCVVYCSSEQFTNEYIDALQNRRLLEFRRKYRTVDLLLIDDIHFLGGKERLQEEFFHTFNALSDSHRQIVMTSDRPASEITGLEQRLVSRFEWGLVTELNLPDFETRIAILRNKASQLEVVVANDVLQFLAEHIRSNIRRLEGALIRVASYASLTRKEVTIELAERLLHDSLDQERLNTLSFDRIQRAVAEHYDVRLADMSSKRRPQAIAFPRQVAMYMCRRLTASSLPEIGGAFGKTHATVLHACNSIEKRAANDPQIRQSLLNIAKKLGATL